MYFSFIYYYDEKLKIVFNEREYVFVLDYNIEEAYTTYLLKFVKLAETYFYQRGYKDNTV